MSFIKIERGFQRQIFGFIKEIRNKLNGFVTDKRLILLKTHFKLALIKRRHISLTKIKFC